MHDSDSVLGVVKKIPQLTKVHSELNDLYGTMKVAFLTSRTPSSGETEQKIITVKFMLHFKSGCSDKR